MRISDWSSDVCSSDLLAVAAVTVDFAYDFRGNGWLSLAPQAGDTRWRVTSPWPHPSFQGGFLPVERSVSEQGFTATYRVGNLALGQSLVSTGAPEGNRSEEHTSELQSLMRISYAVFCLKKKTK